MDYKTEVAEALLKIGAVGFKINEPITFKSGLKSPVYVDNRRFPFHPTEWRLIIEAFKNLIKEDKINFEIVAGAELAGIPHSSALGYSLNKPSVMVRKHSKGYGLDKRVEGGDITGKKVLMLEDLVSTGSTSLSMIEALQKEGGLVEDCLIIVTYGFKESQEAFNEAKIKLHALTSFRYILDAAEHRNMLNLEGKEIVEDWLKDPHGWAERHGF